MKKVIPGIMYGQIPTDLKQWKWMESSMNSKLGNVVVILVSPRVSENIGAAARAMKNFGMNELRLVAPRNLDMDKARKMARKGIDILESMTITETLKEAVSDLIVVGATTARIGSTRSALTYSPKNGAKKLLEGTDQGKVGIVFGPEERGLSTRDLDVSSVNITIPTSPDFASLNLAQAILLICYELFSACDDAPVRSTPVIEPIPPATGKEKEGLFVQAREFLLEAGFLNKQNPDAVLAHLRKLLDRANPTSHEITTLRGVIRQVKWYAQNSEKKN